jgi:uncharacterized repeat protein (TIGR03803 family)
MRRNTLVILVCVVSLPAAVLITAECAWAAGFERSIHVFPASGTGAKTPVGGLTFDSAGNIYGTTSAGGPANNGAVFKMTPTSGEGWSYSVIYVFKGNIFHDGRKPLSSLVVDNAGNLYGTTYYGGVYGGGTVFELMPKPTGEWSEVLLHEFGSGLDGLEPTAGLVFDTQGNLFGTTSFGGEHGDGSVFQLTPNSDGTWAESILYSFQGEGQGDGSTPLASLVIDDSGNLYGTTNAGGTLNNGTVFEVSESAGGSWTESTLYSFQGIPDAVGPAAGLTFDTAANLYGTSSHGGAVDGGTVFELSQAGGSWDEKIIHSFKPSAGDGVEPLASVTFDAGGNIYGTTFGGGANGAGIVFKLLLKSDNLWLESGYSFLGATNGSEPQASVVLDSAGNVYGTASMGGDLDGCHDSGCGVVFEIRH